MKKIVYFSFGHVDVTLPLVKHLFNKKVDIEFVFAFQSARPGESVFHFPNSVNTVGFLSNEEIKSQVPFFIKEYLGEAINCIKVFMYPTFKLFSISTFKSNLLISKYARSKDVIHVSGAGLFIWDRWMSRRKKLIVTLHDHNPHTGEGSRLGLSELLEKKRTEYCDHLIVQNKTDLDWFFQHSKQKQISYIPFATLDYLRSINKKENRKIFSFIFFGRISEYKGLQFLLDAFKIVSQKYPLTELCIAGSGSSETLKEFSKLKNVKIINEFIETEKLVELVVASKFAVCPYVDATQSGVATTAFSLGVPVIASDIGGFRDVIVNGKNGLLVIPANAEALAKAMLRTIEEPGLPERMKEQIPLTLNELGFNWEKISDQLINIYRSN